MTEKDKAKAFYTATQRDNERRRRHKEEQAAKYQEAQEAARKEAERQKQLRANLDQGRATQHLNRVRERYKKQGEYKPPEGQS